MKVDFFQYNFLFSSFFVEFSSFVFESINFEFYHDLIVPIFCIYRDFHLNLTP